LLLVYQAKSMYKMLLHYEWLVLCQLCSLVAGKVYVATDDSVYLLSDSGSLHVVSSSSPMLSQASAAYLDDSSDDYDLGPLSRPCHALSTQPLDLPFSAGSVSPTRSFSPVSPLSFLLISPLPLIFLLFGLRLTLSSNGRICQDVSV
uniref:Uncharacterized protein n=1 Tax=Amphimedon queenslandica TaxID=400682 RepID=A0A1X7U5N7_AMPQE